MATRDEAIAGAAQVYRQILADPERAAAIREHRAAKAAEQAATTDQTKRPRSA